MRPAAIKYLHSAGGVIFKRSDGAVQVALISVKDGTVWTLPKGIIDRGETPETTAVREIEEETGLTGRVVSPLDEKSYWFYLKGENAKCKKTVTYFLLEYVAGNIEDFCDEVDEARWFEIDDAVKHLSYKSDRDIVEKAKENLPA